jgi:hypothetical protein
MSSDPKRRGVAVVQDVERPETTGVLEGEGPVPLGKVEAEAVALGEGIGARHEDKLAGHPQVEDEQRAVRKVEEEELASAAEADDAPALHHAQRGWSRLASKAVAEDPHPLDPLPEKALPQAQHHRLYFRKLRHFLTLLRFEFSRISNIASLGKIATGK